MKKVKLGDICSILNGYAFKSDKYVNHGIRIIRIANVQKGFIEDADPQFYPKSEMNEIKRYMLEEGDILMSLTGNVGRVALLQKSMLPAALNQRVACLRIKDIEEVYKPYIFHYLNADSFENKSVLSSKGVAQKNMSTEWLKEVQIPLPSIEEQKEIADRLDKVVALIENRKEQLAKLDQLVKSRFIEMFGDVSYFVNITDIAHTYIGLVTTMTKHYCSSGTPLLFNSSIKSDKIVWDGTYLDAEFAEANKSRMHKTNDIVTVHTGDIGTSAVVGEEFNNSLGFATIVTRIHDISRYYPRFVSSFLNYGSGKEQLKKYSRDVRNNLNLKDFNRLMVPNVSALEQKRYVDFLEQTDKSKFEIQQSIDKIETLKKSLMQQYFG